MKSYRLCISINSQSKLLIYSSFLRTPKPASQYPEMFQQRYRLLNSFSQLCAAEEFGCSCAVLSTDQFSLGEGVIQAGTWLCWVSFLLGLGWRKGSTHFC